MCIRQQAPLYVWQCPMPHQPSKCASGTPQEEIGVAGFLELPIGNMVLLRPSSGHGWAEVMPEELVLGAGTQQLILTQTMPLFSPRSKGATAKLGWGAKTQSQESHCLHRAQLLFLHTEQYGQGTTVAERTHAGLTMGQDSGKCCLLDPGWASVQEQRLPWPLASQDGFPLVKGLKAWGQRDI